MNRVYAPHLGRDVVLGGMRSPTLEHHASKPKFKTMLAMANATNEDVPPSIAWTGPAMSVLRDIEGNNQCGDCVEAEEAHFLAVVTSNAKTLFAYVTGMVLAMYSAITGYDATKGAPGSNPTDVGTNPLDALDWFTKNAYEDGSTNLGYVLVDATNKLEIMQALAWFGNLKIWLCLPDAYVSPFPAKNGFVWDVAPPNAQQGHCIGAYGYVSQGDAPEAVKVLGANALGLIIATWGLIGTMTWAAVAALCIPEVGGGMATRLSRDWIEANGATPFGETADQVEAAFRAMGGSDDFAPQAVIGPQGTPQPAPGPTGPSGPASPPAPATPPAPPAPRPFIPRAVPTRPVTDPRKKPWRS
jgi:hypothetical protein